MKLSPKEKRIQEDRRLYNLYRRLIEIEILHSNEELWEKSETKNTSSLGFYCFVSGNHSIMIRPILAKYNDKMQGRLNYLKDVLALTYVQRASCKVIQKAVDRRLYIGLRDIFDNDFLQNPIIRVSIQNLFCSPSIKIGGFYSKNDLETLKAKVKDIREVEREYYEIYDLYSHIMID
ncbi:hypothetical protein BKH46_08740 [Helicobacter sp. 12S02634-8]|uniref:hypothetical protein n=1 Tax=Helicobacter sp. 12S02634-8 TaxID=1476199 RepID=UPI000BA54DF6|nr:hypothetical protein [Helicobacter sp. 12S02634-8]PAF46155.1 hypothetical protein BKH46_08740 [Helicobacter sp. 12S02634-8]